MERDRRKLLSNLVRRTARDGRSTLLGLRQVHRALLFSTRGTAANPARFSQDVWRQKETALAANQLTNLLLANASHEGVSLLPSFLLRGLLTVPLAVRTPLNAIIKWVVLSTSPALSI